MQQKSFFKALEKKLLKRIENDSCHPQVKNNAKEYYPLLSLEEISKAIKGFVNELCFQG